MNRGLIFYRIPAGHFFLHLTAKWSCLAIISAKPSAMAIAGAAIWLFTENGMFKANRSMRAFI
jgi:hypothetical protein